MKIHDGLQRVAQQRQADVDGESDLYSSHEAVPQIPGKRIQAMTEGVCTSVANVGQLVNYYAHKGSLHVAAVIIDKSWDLCVDVRPLGEKTAFFSDVPCVDYQRDAPELGHFCTLCEPVQAPASGGMEAAGQAAQVSE